MKPAIAALLVILTFAVITDLGTRTLKVQMVQDMTFYHTNQVWLTNYIIHERIDWRTNTVIERNIVWETNRVESKSWNIPWTPQQWYYTNYLMTNITNPWSLTNRSAITTNNLILN